MSHIQVATSPEWPLSLRLGAIKGYASSQYNKFYDSTRTRMCTSIYYYFAFRDMKYMI